MSLYETGHTFLFFKKFKLNNKIENKRIILQVTEC